MIEVLGAFVFGVLVLIFVIWVAQLVIARLSLPSPMGQIMLAVIALVGLYILWLLLMPVLQRLGA